MADSTIYQPLISTLTYSQPPFERAKTFSLAPQTTAFSAQDTLCPTYPRDIRCQTRPESLTSGATCLGDEPVSSKFSDLPNLAFPGTACISGWTTACNTTLTLASAKTFVQTWCCPPGSWSCLTVEAGTPYRDCVSILSTPTEVWVNNIATSGGTESTLWSSWRKVSLSDLPAKGPISIKHPPFPLYGRNPTPEGGVAENTGLSTGAIAGIAVGAVVAALLLVGSGIFVCLRKRKQRRAVLAQMESGTDARDPYQKGMGYDTKQELPGQGSESRELDSLSPPPQELSSQTRIVEVDGSRPVELA
ncbi:hypothetical protein Cob_v001527 [Colletotrichum orbiculare MAFF 240422]|uniref:Uncharacterized protein n=1 Tax=Colletotrichum orbiculare (strain 104-T / ATCC 96160 / CBS 514.97 / LARS 414 / MAFF 240422) TaxID=1213857 RepID=A0A484G6N6_COLOR|nr:hypothetical protein Cob_v001527 [Colletotrichum orbiculare MAFF 240422]